MVSAADKLHNLSSILRDYQVQGEALRSRFKAGKEGTLWYYRSLIAEFAAGGTALVVTELRVAMGGCVPEKGQG